MSDIDDKLREILILGDRDVLPANYDQQIEAIHSAFGEAGYMTPGVADASLKVATVYPAFIDGRMTGQEWYQAFMAELNKLKFKDTITSLDEVLPYINDLKHGVEVAAKRAAGLDT